MSGKNNQSDQDSPGPDVLVIRAVFVPDGQSPPPEFGADISPLRIPVEIDAETGEMTSDSGVNIGGGVRAEWHPGAGDDQSGDDDQSQGSDKDS